MIYTLYISSLIISAVIAAALAFYLWRRRSKPGATPAVWMMLAVVIWSLGYVLQYTSTTLSGQIVATNIQYFGIVALPVAWFVFSLEYTGHVKWLTRRNLFLLAIVPFVTVVLAWTNGIDGLMWYGRHLETSGPFIIIAKTYGPWFWIHTAYSYLLLLSGIFLLLRRLFRPPRLYREQFIALLICVIVPVTWNVLYIFNLDPIYHMDLSPSAFVISGLAMAWGLFRFRLFDITPLARDTIIEDMSDGVIVLDAQNRFIDINPAAQRIFGYSLPDVIGQPFAHILSQQPELVESASARIVETHVEIAIEKGGTRHYYESRISPLYGRRGHLTGRLVALSDITERKQAEEALQRANQALRMLSECNQAVVRATNESDLLRDVCRIMVEIGGYRLAWVGLAEQDEEKTVRPVAWAGCDDESLVTMNVTWADTERGRGPIGMAIRIGTPSIAQQILTDPNFEDWRTDAVKHGYGSFVAIPLISWQVLGALNIYKVEPDGFPPEEVGLLVELADNLAHGITALRTQAERKRAEGKITQYEELDKLKSSLLSTVSHELHTPLATIKGYSTLLLDYDERMRHDEKREYLGFIDRATDRLIELVDHLLDMSQLEAGLLHLQKESFSISGLMNDVLAEAKLRAPGHEIVLKLPKRLPRLGIDVRRIRQVLDNVIDNAIKYSKKGTRVVIEARQMGAELQVSVADQGTGIPAEDLGKVFDRMYRVEQRVSPAVKGVGLGLAICKGLVEAHGGRIWAESKVGRGSTFYFTLPLDTERRRNHGEEA